MHHYAILGLGAALFLAGWVHLALRRRVAALAKTAQRLAAGEHTVRARDDGADEVAALAQALNAVAQNSEATIAELNQEKAQLGAIALNIVEAVAAVEADGRIFDVNPALCKLFGVRREDAWDKPFVEFLRNPQLSELLGHALKEGRARMEEATLFTPEERVFEAHALPLIREAKKQGALLVLHDITRIRRLEKMRRDFVANVSHELRTPLASIRGYAETLRDGAVDDKEHRDEFLEAVEKDAERLSALVDDLLDLSAIESGHRKPQPEPVAPLAVAREAASALKRTADKRKVAIEIVESGALPEIKADRGQLRQILNNLIENAIKFNKEGGRVTVRGRAAGDVFELSVEDTGLGIPPADLPRVFERFYRVEKARSREMGGTGLGLAIVKHMVEAHGGTVTASSEVGKGSTFTVRLPL